jgi:hypothetical protein
MLATLLWTESQAWKFMRDTDTKDAVRHETPAYTNRIIIPFFTHIVFHVDIKRGRLTDQVAQVS